MTTRVYAEGRLLNGRLTEEPLDDTDSEQLRRSKAERGSKRLRDAILRAQGIEPPKAKRQPKRKEIHVPERCPHCGAPKMPLAIVGHIQAAVSAYYGIEPIAMTSQQRKYEWAHPRQVAMYLCAKITPKSISEIGRRFGGRDHTTVLYAVRAVENRISTDDEVALDVASLFERLAA